jgi:drug/metabolite transporter superfamily protein YnfA
VSLAAYQRELATFVLRSISQALQLAGLVMSLFYAAAWVVTDDAPGRWLMAIGGAFAAAALLWSVAATAPTLGANEEPE